MTVITKPLSEKKGDKLDEPLVENIHTEFPEVKGADVEKGSAGPGGDPRLLIIRRPLVRRSSSATTVCLFLTAVFVMCCGIIAGVYLYRQFAFAQMHRFRGWCRIPYDEVNGNLNAAYQSSPFDQDAPAAHLEELGLLQRLGKLYNDQPKNSPTGGNFLREEFEIDTEEESYEKITVPDFVGGKRSRFIHDFNSNKTGIIDLDGKRCFVMPLNRSQVLPPKSLLDLVQKMWSGYYELDTSVLHETMRVVVPPIDDASQMGVYIQKECAGYPIYKLEKVVSGVVKRSASFEAEKFTAFAGKMTSFDISNMGELMEYEAQKKVLADKDH